jgi:DNA-binding NtrC family response regulator
VTPKCRLLVVDDDRELLTIVSMFARQLGFDVVSKQSGEEALACLEDVKPDAVLVDLRMPGLSGLDVLRAVRTVDPVCQVILMTGNATVETAIEAVKAGALDYLCKPFELDRLRDALGTARESIQRRERTVPLDADGGGAFEFQGMIGRSPAMQELFDSIRRFAPHGRTVLVHGETGTGKELVAKALHQLSRRSSRRFLTLNCSAVVETLVESELFGHMRGAFTGATDAKIGLFEHADGGTLFLDETGEMPLPLQAKLLRAVEYGDIQRVGSLETRKVDVHVIAATHRDLRAEAAAGRFRSDLFYRLSTIELRVPPLRERREDIPHLMARFVKEASARLKRPITGVTQAGERLLMQATWPGNIRELRNVVERACIMGEGEVLHERDIAKAMAGSAEPVALPAMPPPQPALAPETSDTAGPAEGNLFAAAQREQIEKVLRAVGGNKVAAAKQLGMSRRSLYRWLERLDIPSRS